MEEFELSELALLVSMEERMFDSGLVPLVGGEGGWSAAEREWLVGVAEGPATSGRFYLKTIKMS